MHRIFEKSVTAKGTLKGKLDVYRYIDNVSQMQMLSSLAFSLHL